jgi:hypothetical protein
MGKEEDAVIKPSKRRACFYLFGIMITSIIMFLSPLSPTLRSGPTSCTQVCMEKLGLILKCRNAKSSTGSNQKESLHFLHDDIDSTRSPWPPVFKSEKRNYQDFTNAYIQQLHLHTGGQSPTLPRIYCDPLN